MKTARRQAREIALQALYAWQLSGDDYELLFTAAAERRGDLAALARELRIPLSRIGSIARGEAKLAVLDESGRPLPYRGGFDHFGK